MRSAVTIGQKLRKYEWKKAISTNPTVYDPLDIAVSKQVFRSISKDNACERHVYTVPILIMRTKLELHKSGT